MTYNGEKITTSGTEGHPLIGHVVDIPAGVEIDRSTCEDGDIKTLDAVTKATVIGFYNNALQVKIEEPFVLPDGSVDTDIWYWHQPEPEKNSIL